MHIEISRMGGNSAALATTAVELAGNEPGRIRPPAGSHVGLAADTVRPLQQEGGALPVGGALMMRVDGATVVEVAGLRGAPAVTLEGGGWMPAAADLGQDTLAAPAPSFFGQATNERCPLLGGTAAVGSLVLVGVGEAVFCVTADACGEWSLDTAVSTPMSGRFDLGPDGVKELLITSVDAAGNSRGVAGVFTLDTTPPPVPVLETRVVERGRVVFQGMAEAGSEVTVAVGGAIYVAPTDVAGRWCIDTRVVEPVSGALKFGPDGGCRVTLVCCDAAGNTSSCESSFLLQTRALHVVSPSLPAVSADLPQGDASPLLAAVNDVTRRLMASFGGRRNGLQQPRA